MEKKLNEKVENFWELVRDVEKYKRLNAKRCMRLVDGFIRLAYPSVEKNYAKNNQKEMLEDRQTEQDPEWCPYCDSAYHDESDCPALASFYSY